MTHKEYVQLSTAIVQMGHYDSAGQLMVPVESIEKLLKTFVDREEIKNAKTKAGTS